MSGVVLVSIQLLLYALLWAITVRVVQRDSAAAWHWLGYCLCSALAVAMVGRRAADYGWLQTLFMDLLLMVGLILARRGTEVFVHVKPADRLFASLLMLTVVALACIGTTVEAKPYRVAWICTLGAVVVGGSLRSCRQAMLREFGTTATHLAGLPGLAMTILLLSTAAASVWQAHRGIVTPAAETEAASQLVTLVSAGIFNFMFVFLVMARLVRVLQHQASHDPLTGLLNRRAMTERLDAEWQRHGRAGTGFCLLALDIDHFKRINDRHGHAAGDQVLREVAQLLTRTVRRMDHVGRMGGEEFLVLMPECSPAGDGGAAAERLRQALASCQVALPDGYMLQITASWGVAGTEPGDQCPDDSLRRADSALYAAKHSGRNCVRLA